MKASGTLRSNECDAVELRSEWGALPMDSIATLVNSCNMHPRDIASMRVACRYWRHAVDTVLDSLTLTASAHIDHFSCAPRRYPLLKSLDIRSCDYRLFAHKLLYKGCQTQLSRFVSHLASMPSLTHISISCNFATEMGRKLWAWQLCERVFTEAPAAAATAATTIMAQTSSPETVIGSATHTEEEVVATQAAASTDESVSPTAATAKAELCEPGEPPSQPPQAGAGAAQFQVPVHTGHTGLPAVRPPADDSVTSAKLTSPAPVTASSCGQSSSVPSSSSDVTIRSHNSYCVDPSIPAGGVSAAKHTSRGLTVPSSALASLADQQQAGSSQTGALALHPAPATASGACSSSHGNCQAAGTTSHAEAQQGAPSPQCTDGTPASPAAPAHTQPGQQGEANSREHPHSPPNPHSYDLNGGYAPGSASMTAFQTQLWIPDWGQYLPSLQSITITPPPNSSQPPEASVASPPPGSLLDPITHQAQCARVWLRPSSLRSLTSLEVSGVSLGALGPEVLSLTTLTRLDLTGCGLTHVPTDLTPWASRMQKLGLAHNALRTLPPELSRLTHLQCLDAGHNLIEEVPPACLPLGLKTLLLHHNQLREVPAAVLSLASCLRDLKLSHNWLHGVPEFPSLCELTALTRLELANVTDVTHGPLRVTPEVVRLRSLCALAVGDNIGGVALCDEIADLAPSLTQLDLREVFLVEVPPALGRLTSLRRLRLGGNCLTSLPPWLGDVNSLVTLELGRNTQIKTLPSSLSRLTRLRLLDVSHCGLSELPGRILGALPALTTLDASHNPLRYVPPALGSAPRLQLVRLVSCGLSDTAVRQAASMLGRSHGPSVELHV